MFPKYGCTYNKYLQQQKAKNGFPKKIDRVIISRLEISYYNGGFT